MHNRIATWISVAIGLLTFLSMAGAAMSQVADNTRHFNELQANTKDGFRAIHRELNEIHLEGTQGRIDRILAVPVNQRQTWQTQELIRLQSVKEKQLRRLENG